MADALGFVLLLVLRGLARLAPFLGRRVSRHVAEEALRIYAKLGEKHRG